MRLCIVLPSHLSAGFGGAEYQVSLLIERLLETIPTAEVVYLARNVNQDFHDSRYSVIKLRSFLSIRKLGYFADSVSLYRSLRKVDPDIIYQRIGCAYTGVVAAYAKRHRKTMIWHVSIDNDLANHTDRFPWLTRGIERALRDFGIRRATQIVTQSNFQAQLLKKVYGRNAIVVRNFHPAPMTDVPKTSSPTIVWVANMKPAKRPELFVEVANQLRDIPGIRFVMAGRNGQKEPYSTLLADAVKTLPLSYVGELPQDAINDLIGSAWVLVNTSSVEGFPNTFIQAWQRRTLVASLSANPDGVLHQFGVAGTGNNTILLAEQVRKLILTPTEYSRTTIAAQEYVNVAHGMHNADRLIDLFGVLPKVPC